MRDDGGRPKTSRAQLLWRTTLPMQLECSAALKRAVQRTLCSSSEQVGVGATQPAAAMQGLAAPPSTTGVPVP